MSPQIDTPIHKQNLVLPGNQWEAFDPFLIMAEDNMKKGAFDHHSHRGIETVTYMIDGVLKHKDNLGNAGELRKGDVQWMTAGKGILHIEEAQEDGFAHLLQLWVNLPAEHKMVEPRYQEIPHIEASVRKENGAEIKVISGSSAGVISHTKNFAAVTMVEISLQANHSVVQDFQADFNGFIYIIEGAGVFGANKVAGKKNDVLWLTPSVDNPSEVELHATEPLLCVVIAGKPLREPVEAKGPFVMNTEEQIKQAFKDFREGRFGDWPQN
ncbi:pirin family protein [Belliella marina]|uniref:Pirin family protein n=1 Tax=Belliella marina TaxID=1644146 RepID=A0ABW4VL19_9BACT